jgi:DNA polymerase III epsilon subunit family exonuclease
VSRGIGSAVRRSAPIPVPPRSADAATFDALGPTLAELTFVVVDLETSGGSPEVDAITEVAAVKVRGGEVLGELATLVNPGTAINPYVTDLTGIGDDMVRAAPPISAVLPSLLEFMSGAVLVAHNAGFDVSFLRAACQRHDRAWPDPPVLDTVQLARRVLATDDDVPDCRLATLAQVFHASVAPTHRALDDARATVDVLHGLFERVGCEGVTTFEELRSYNARLSPIQRRKRFLPDTVPPTGGVFVFLDATGTVIHVGYSDDVHAHLRRLVTSSALPRRQLDLLAVTERVDVIACATGLEAEVRQVRLRAAAGLKPPAASFGTPEAGVDASACTWLRQQDEVRAVQRAADPSRADSDLVAVLRRGRLHGSAWSTPVDAAGTAATLATEPPVETPPCEGPRRVTKAETQTLLHWLERDDVEQLA